MLKKLRIKFIFINMMMAILVLTFTFGLVCYLNYASTLNIIFTQLDSTMAQVAATLVPQINGVRPITLDDPLQDVLDESTVFYADTSLSTNSTRSSASSSVTTNETDNTSAIKSGSSVSAFVYDESESDASANDSTAQEFIVEAPSIGSQGSQQTFFGAENQVALIAVYRVNSQGIYTTIPDFSVASIAENVLLRANDIVIHSSENRGLINEYRLAYERISSSDGYIIAYEDASNLDNWKSLAILLGGVGSAALLIFFLINLAFARWTLRPIAASIRRQRESIIQQQRFTADASHELKTPLTVILANMSILKSEPENKVGDEMQWIDSTQQEAERMQRLVNDMLDLVRPKELEDESAASVNENAAKHSKKAQEAAAKSDPLANAKPLDFSDIVEGEVLQFESVAFERGITIESDIEPNIQVLGDEDRLGRMITTLIDNACKYADPDTTVDVVLTQGDAEKHPEADSLKHRYSMKPTSFAILKVHNSGNPISQEDITHLFDRFYRADKARTSGKGGYGLGLSIGQTIALEHNGLISVESSEEEGTTFTVELPQYVEDREGF